jgi:hypothetical protein
MQGTRIRVSRSNATPLSGIQTDPPADKCVPRRPGRLEAFCQVSLHMTELHDTAVPGCDPMVSPVSDATSRLSARKPSVTVRSEGAMSASANEALVRQAIELVWNRGDLEAADDLFAFTYVNHYGLIADLVLGPEAVKISAALYRVAFPGLHVSVAALDTIEDTVVIRWTATKGFGNRSDDSAIESSQKLLTGITRIRFADGKIIESWTEWDRIGVLRELGIPTE